MRTFKVTDRDMKTRNGFQYTLGKLIENPQKLDYSQTTVLTLCNSYWLHSFQFKELAVLLHNYYCGYHGARLFIAEMSGLILYGDYKVGSTGLTLLEEIEIPEIDVKKAFEAVNAMGGKRVITLPRSMYSLGHCIISSELHPYDIQEVYKRSVMCTE